MELFKNRAAWARWLGKLHNVSQGIWLRLEKGHWQGIRLLLGSDRRGANRIQQLTEMLAKKEKLFL